MRSRAGSVVGVPVKSVSSSAGKSSAEEVSGLVVDDDDDDDGDDDDDDSGVEVRDRGGGQTMDAGRSFQCSLIVPD